VFLLVMGEDICGTGGGRSGKGDWGMSELGESRGLFIPLVVQPERELP
jgi:hypothetical protein